MKLVDELYDTYKDHFSADEEDIYPIIYGVLEAKTKEDIFDQLNELSQENLCEMVTLYIIDQLQKKLAEEGIGHVTLGQDYTGDYLQ
ncbi:DUF6154 family protein [Pseudalkalibacillus berkeleyi]|uniref:DUF6154 family protein n=1 Tax=Pseudalkalibacillus berkeleyi TaxID=1069813 RepID=A0ABS9GYD0_9BACL|nr:DUF6154 family protein [Pseudalkalibacillus berkeleyi]MCF6136695.1 DUF6154 family protein [Pseudalkalibacillus berkeleyi]